MKTFLFKILKRYRYLGIGAILLAAGVGLAMSVSYAQSMAKDGVRIRKALAQSNSWSTPISQSIAVPSADYRSSNNVPGQYNNRGAPSNNLGLQSYNAPTSNGLNAPFQDPNVVSYGTTTYNPANRSFETTASGNFPVSVDPLQQQNGPWPLSPKQEPHLSQLQGVPQASFGRAPYIPPQPPTQDSSSLFHLQDDEWTRDSHALASSIRSSVNDPEKNQEWRERLRSIVTKQFRARQEKRKEDLEQLKKSVAALEKTIAERDSKAEEIIDRRISDLQGQVDPMSWDYQAGRRGPFESTSPNPSLPGIQSPYPSKPIGSTFNPNQGLAFDFGSIPPEATAPSSPSPRNPRATSIADPNTIPNPNANSPGNARSAPFPALPPIDERSVIAKAVQSMSDLYRQSNSDEVKANLEKAILALKNQEKNRGLKPAAPLAETASIPTLPQMASLPSERKDASSAKASAKVLVTFKGKPVDEVKVRLVHRETSYASEVGNTDATGSCSLASFANEKAGELTAGKYDVYFEIPTKLEKAIPKTKAPEVELIPGENPLQFELSEWIIKEAPTEKPQVNKF